MVPAWLMLLEFDENSLNLAICGRQRGQGGRFRHVVYVGCRFVARFFHIVTYMVQVGSNMVDDVII